MLCLKRATRNAGIILTGSPHAKKNINWKIEFAKTHSLKLFSVSTHTLKCDPNVPADAFGTMPDFVHVLKCLPADQIKSIE